MHSNLAIAPPRGDEPELPSSPSASDVSLFTDALQAGDLATTEHFENDLYLDAVIWKPWGHEYRVYADLLYDVWKLSIEPGESTSTHCHPRKETALLCLAGSGRVQLLNRAYTVSAGDLVVLRKGVFHGTENIGDVPLELIEVETPRNKLDLVRVRDKYGRQGRRYETKTLDGDVPNLEPSAHASGAKVRPTSLHASYRFQIVSAGELTSTLAPTWIFAVSLSLSRAFRHDIRVLRPAEIGAGLRGDPSEHYLVIESLKTR